jgi:hypothetical protein
MRILPCSIRRHHPLAPLTLSLVVLAGMLGCGGGVPKRPPTHAVSGVVTLGGKPLADAVVTFRPRGGQQPANGRTDAAGGYSMATFSAGDGAMAGEYAVAIMKYEAPAPVTASTDENSYVPPNGQLPAPKNVLDKKYADTKSSGLTATVVAGPGNTINFELKK